MTITITATILPSAAGTTVSNQGTIHFDADGNGTNEAMAQTDDPAVTGGSNPTAIEIAPALVVEVPTLSELGILLLVAALAALGLLKLRQS